MNNFARNGYRLPNKSGNGIAICFIQTCRICTLFRQLLFPLCGMGDLNTGHTTAGITFGVHVACRH
jgi:hypothetical protein